MCKTQVTDKLKDTRGASIIIALLLFLVCGCVAAVIIGSASTNAERTRQHAFEERSYFAVSSALYQGQVAFEQYKPTVKLTKNGDTWTPTFTKPTITAGQWSQELQDWICAQVQANMQNGASTAELSVDVEVSGQPGDALPKVTLTYTMANFAEGDCNVTITAHQDGGADAEYAKDLSATYAYESKVDSEGSNTATAGWIGQIVTESDGSGDASEPRNGFVLTSAQIGAAALSGWTESTSRYLWVWKTKTDAAGATCLVATYTGNDSGAVSLAYRDGTFYKPTSASGGPVVLAGNFYTADLSDGGQHADASGNALTWAEVTP